MLLLFQKWGTALLCLLLASSAAYAEDDQEIWETSLTRVWLDDHVAAAQGAPRTRASYKLARTQIWTNGILRSDAHAFVPTDFDRAVGAKLQPFHDLNLNIGTELIRGGGDNRFLSSRASWEAFWAEDWENFGGIKLGLSTSGSLASLQSAYSQSVGGSLGVPFALPLDMWRTELRLSPSMNLDLSNGVVGTALMSEILGQKVLSSPADAFRSVLNVRVGYGIAPNAHPSASARLELRISPNL
jgi:hypothetical protein